MRLRAWGTLRGYPSACPVCRPEPFLGGAFVPCAGRLAARLAEIEAEEAAGKRKLVIDGFRFSNPEFEAFYSEFDALSPSRRSWQALRFSEPGKERRILVLAGSPLG